MVKRKDGWQMCAGFFVRVEDGRIIQGVTNDRNGQEVPTYPYKYGDFGGGCFASSWTRPEYYTFRAACYRGKAGMR